jgi:allophanate hydrolase subunit 1
MSAQASDNNPRRLWRIPAAFGPTYAPQLEEVAALAGLTPEEAVAQIEATTVRVIAIGFAPGQPYLGMLPPAWDVPRQTTLTDSLPRGALISAVRQLIIWAADAPTGWRHVGQTAFRVYLPETPDPFAFEPGDAVQFSAVSDGEFRDIQANTDTNGGATCEVLR